MMSWNSNCAISNDGLVYCWGDGSMSGNSSLTYGNYNAPTTTDSFGNGITARSIGVHENLVCVILSNDNVSCWGSNGWGEIGDGTFVNRHTPTPTIDLGIAAGQRTVVQYPHQGQSSQTPCTTGTYQPSTAHHRSHDAANRN